MLTSLNVRLSLLFLFCTMFAAAPALAVVKPNSLFSDNAVLQQGTKVPVWGTASEGESVTVKIAGQEVSTKAIDGKWRVDLAPLKAGGPHEMIVAGENTVTLKNILVGEVWIASGQSNMQWELRHCVDPEKAISESANPQIHLVMIKRQVEREPREDADAKWVECDPKSVPGFSGVAYFFGRDLQKQLNVPVGLIGCNYGGSSCEAWMSRPALAADPAFEKLAEDNQYVSNQSSCGLYNAMLHPLIPYAFRGVIWYQGETNAIRAHQYRTLFPALIKDWRAQWKQGDFPFLFVQLAPFQKIDSEPKDSDWAELRDAQLLTSQTTPSTAMAVITDVGDEGDPHPRWKEPVGARLALAARAIAYGEKIPYSGPEFSQQQIDGERILLSFKHADGGLQVQGGQLRGFAIAGADRKFVNADAVIQGNKVVVSSPAVKVPVAVRFGWANYPTGNLWNGAGLPASPFRTDDFPLTTEGK